MYRFEDAATNKLLHKIFAIEALNSCWFFDRNKKMCMNIYGF